MAQGPDAVLLTLPYHYRRFPNWDGNLPELPDGVTLLRGLDHGPASKLVEAAKSAPDADLLICDDDCDYDNGWLATFRSARERNPGTVIAASVFDTGRLGVGLAPGHTIVQGFAGVLLPPTPLLPLLEDPLNYADDLWLSASIAAARRPVIQTKSARQWVYPTDAPAQLQDDILGGLSRAELYKQAALSLSSTHGIWR